MQKSFDRKSSALRTVGCTVAYRTALFFTHLHGKSKNSRSFVSAFVNLYILVVFFTVEFLTNLFYNGLWVMPLSRGLLVCVYVSTYNVCTSAHVSLTWYFINELHVLLYSSCLSAVIPFNKLGGILVVFFSNGMFCFQQIVVTTYTRFHKTFLLVLHQI